METLAATCFVQLVDATLKVTVLLVLAAGVCQLLRRAPAGVRSSVWGLALAGAVCIPAASHLLPPLPLPILPGLEPQPSSQATTGEATHQHRPIPEVNLTGSGHAPAGETLRAAPVAPGARPRARRFSICAAAVVTWLAGLLIVMLRHVVGVMGMRRMVKRGRPLGDPDWQLSLSRCTHRLGLQRDVLLVASGDVEIPVTFGLLQPAIVLPEHADSWCRERREVVLLHELVHIRRADWAVRLAARVVCAAYWFNPLSWLALHRLASEQELACDQDVLWLGTAPSSYASHLLAIARAALPRLAPSPLALGLARRTALEERIMAILDPQKRNRTSSVLVISSLLLTVALVPALAAVQLWAQPAAATSNRVTTTNSELRAAIEDLNRIEHEMRPQLDRLEAAEIDMTPYTEELEAVAEEMQKHLAPLEDLDLELEPFLEQLEAVELDMAPYLEGFEDIEIEMEPLLSAMEALHEEMEPHLDRLHDVEYDSEDLDLGNLRTLGRSIREALEPLHEQLADLHVQLDPFHERMSELHQQMEPLHERMQEIHHEMEPLHERVDVDHAELEPFQERMQELHHKMEPFHERMQEIHREMEPLHEEMERVHDRLVDGLKEELETILRNELAAFTDSAAPFAEAAARVVRAASIHLDDDALFLDAPRSEVRRILTDLFTAHSTTSDDVLEDAIDRAASAVSELEIAVG